LVAKLPENEPWKAKLAPLHKYTPYATTYRYATPGGRVPTSPAAAGVVSDASHILTLIGDARNQFVNN
jgi:hypothetical protein